MSYNGTVRCGWCYKSGHNRLKCQELDGYIKRNPHSMEAQRRANSVENRKDRKCSYCRNSGHNRRKCEHLIKDKKKAVEVNKVFCEDTLEAMAETGLGIGSLVQHHSRRNFWTKDGNQVEDKLLFGMITHITWKNLTLLSNENRWNGTPVFIVKWLAQDRSPRAYSLAHFHSTILALEGCRERRVLNELKTKREVKDPYPIPDTYFGKKEVREGRHFIITSPAPAESIIANAPNNWKSGQCGIDVHYNSEYNKNKFLERNEVDLRLRHEPDSDNEY